MELPAGRAGAPSRVSTPQVSPAVNPGRTGVVVLDLLLGSHQAALVFATLVLNMVGFGIVLPLLPVLIKELGGSPLAMSLMVTGWAGAQFLFSPVWGSLSDRLGRRPVLLVGVSGMLVTFLMLALSRSVFWAVMSRLLGGILSAASLPAAQAYLADITPPARRAEAMSTAGAAFGVGFIVGPAVGALLSPLGVRLACLTSAALAAANLMAVSLLLPEPEHRQSLARPSEGTLRALQAARRQPWAVYLYTAFLMAFCASSLFSMLGLYLMDRLRLPETLTGVPFVVQGLVSVLLQFFVVAPAASRLGENRTLILACLVAGIGFVLLALARNLMVACLGVAAAAAGVAFIRPTVAAAVSRRSRLPQGITMGVQTACDALGRTLGPLWAGLAYSWDESAPFASAAVIYAGTALLLRAKAPLLQAPAEVVGAAGGADPSVRLGGR